MNGAEDVKRTRRAKRPDLVRIAAAEGDIHCRRASFFFGYLTAIDPRTVLENVQHGHIIDYRQHRPFGDCDARYQEVRCSQVNGRSAAGRTPAVGGRKWSSRADT